MLVQFPTQVVPPLSQLIKLNAKYSLYVEESGNPLGSPVIYVRGGPGGTPDEREHRWFDPEKYRIIVFDQRGSGRCQPTTESLTEHSSYFADITIDDFVADMETIREQLNIETWTLFGGSWGSILALRYAQCRLKH